MVLIRAALLAAFVISSTTTQAADWPQWLGENRDSVWRETNILDEFPTSGLTVKWRQPIAGGYSGPAVADGRVYVHDYELRSGDPTPSPSVRNELEGSERLHCFDADTGELIWSHDYDCPYQVSYPAGPRATPTVDGDRVYTLGAMGDLQCRSVADGEMIWFRDLKADYGVETPIWGFCGHPLAYGDSLICLVGGANSVAVAFEKLTGEEKWKSLSAKEPGYAPPTVIRSAGVDQLLIWHSEALCSLNPVDGGQYWSVSLEPDYGMSIAAPRSDGDHLFVGAIVNKSMMLELGGAAPTANVVWMGRGDLGIGPCNSTPFLEGDYMYGVDRQGELRCVEITTGKHVWTSYELMPGKERANSGTAFLVKQGDRFFIMSETGELVLARLSPEGYEEISRERILDTTGDAFGRSVVWSHPAFANGCVFARNDKEIVCVSLASDED